MATTAGGQTLPPLSEVREAILTSELLNTIRKDGHDIWTAHKNAQGYGRITVSHKGKRFTLQAHRAIWAAHNGKWPTRFQDIHHKCGNKSCVNPNHLEAVKAVEHSKVVRAKTGWKNQRYDRLRKD